MNLCENFQKILRPVRQQGQAFSALVVYALQLFCPLIERIYYFYLKAVHYFGLSLFFTRVVYFSAHKND